MNEQTEAPKRGRPTNASRAAQRPEQRPLLRTPGNRFDVPYSLIAKYPDMTFEWKVQTVMGLEQQEHKINVEANGWEYVPQEVCPKEFVGSSPQNGKPVIRGGQALMWRAKELTDAAIQMDIDAANEQVRVQAERLGQASRQQVGAKHTKLNRSVVEIPDE